MDGDRIVFVGSQQGGKEWRGPATRLVDGQGCTLMPGFIDSHFHLLMGSLTLDKIRFEVCFGLRKNLGPGNIPLPPRVQQCCSSCSSTGKIDHKGEVSSSLASPVCYNYC